MNTLVSQQTAAVKLNEKECESCSVCFSICPFGAIQRGSETGKIILEVEKCQVCGMCYSTCRAKAIDIIYYDFDSLTKYIQDAKDKYDSDTLVIMCKGSTPDLGNIERLFGVSQFIPLFIPCVGRIPEEVLLKTIVMGTIREIHVLTCDGDYCRFEKGSRLIERKVLILNHLLAQLGYGSDFINLKQNNLKVQVDKDKCIACGNCVFYCPYHAAKLENEVASFNLTLCRGCGLCVALCPAMALELENWERVRISTLISKLSLEIEEPKVLVLRCQWAVLPPLDEELGSHVRAIDMPCAARVDVLHILEAFQNGIDGVLVAACYEEECKQEQQGSREAQHQVAALKERLSQIGLGERLHFCFVAPRYPETYTNELGQFSEAIASDLPKRGSK
jgi:coenzyme F420-reducing hydrogenase delta subunit